MGHVAECSVHVYYVQYYKLNGLSVPSPDRYMHISYMLKIFTDVGRTQIDPIFNGIIFIHCPS